MKTYLRPFREYFKACQVSGLEFVDVIDCEANSEFKKRDPKMYENIKRMSMFSVYVVRKK